MPATRGGHRAQEMCQGCSSLVLQAPKPLGRTRIKLFNTARRCLVYRVGGDGEWEDRGAGYGLQKEAEDALSAFDGPRG